MSNIIDTINNYDIPTDSVFNAIRFLNDHGELTDDEYTRRLEELMNQPVDINENIPPRFAYLYFIQTAIKFNGSLSPEQTLNVALNDATSFITRNKWVLNIHRSPIDINGEPKTKKGRKKEMAIAVYLKHKNENLTRKQWIALLVKEVDLTPAGASTYYHNLKTGKYS